MSTQPSQSGVRELRGQVNPGESAHTVLVTWENGEGEEFDIVKPDRADEQAIRSFVQTLLDADYQPGGTIAEIVDFSGVVIHSSRI